MAGGLVGAVLGGALGALKAQLMIQNLLLLVCWLKFKHLVR